MQEEIEQKSATLMINGTKFSLHTLKSAALRLLAHRQNPSAPGVKHRGKETVRQLVGQNQGVSNIELSGQDLKEFQRITRRYGVDYAIRKVDSDKPRVLVFFKARDSDALTAALKELASTKTRTQSERPSVLQRLEKAKEQAAKATPTVCPKPINLWAKSPPAARR